MVSERKRCQYVFKDLLEEEEVSCTRGVWKGSDRYCVFHDPGKKTEKAKEEFTRALRKQLGPGDFDCRGYEFPRLGNMRISERTIDAFEFTCLLPDSRTIPDGADFRRAHFPLEVVFSDCKFGDAVSFGMARFAQGANFAEATFGDKADFSFSCFGGWANFQVAEFGSEANFSVAQFQKGGSFYWTFFGPGACFAMAELGEVDLQGAKLPEGRFAGCDLSEATINAETDFTGRKDVLGDELCARTGKSDRGDARYAYADAEDAYRRVRQLLKAHGFYHLAGEFYYRERVCRRRGFHIALVPRWMLRGCRPLLHSAGTVCFVARAGWHRTAHRTPALISWVLRAIGLCLGRCQKSIRRSLEAERRHSVLSWLAEVAAFDWLCGYGERPGRLIKRAALFMFIYAVVYFYFLRDWVLTSSGEKLQGFLDALYFSAATFTTLGFGDYAPRGSDWVKLLVVSEAALGVVIIGLAMVTFARKAIRD